MIHDNEPKLKFETFRALELEDLCFLGIFNLLIIICDNKSNLICIDFVYQRFKIDC